MLRLSALLAIAALAGGCDSGFEFSAIVYGEEGVALAEGPDGPFSDSDPVSIDERFPSYFVATSRSMTLFYRVGDAVGELAISPEACARYCRPGSCPTIGDTIIFEHVDIAVTVDGESYPFGIVCGGDEGEVTIRF